MQKINFLQIKYDSIILSIMLSWLIFNYLFTQFRLQMKELRSFLVP